MVKIINEEQKQVYTFDDIKYGEFFIALEGLHMKISDGEGYCFDNDISVEFKYCEMVTPVDVIITVKKKGEVR